MNATDSFVRVAARDYETGDLGVNLAVEVGENIRCELCASLVLQKPRPGACEVADLDARPRPSVAACLLLFVWFRHFFGVLASDSNYIVKGALL